MASGVLGRLRPGALNGWHARTNLHGLFIVTGTAVGGAETMLFKLLSRLTPAHRNAVISLEPLGRVGERMRSCGIPVHALNCTSSWSSLAAVRKLSRMVKAIAPDFIQGWMYHGNLAAEIASVAAGRNVPVLWSIRHSLHALEVDKPSTKGLIHVLARMSRRPQRILYNSKISAEQHERFGYDRRKTVVIPNGFDCELFRPRPECRKAVRAALGLDEHTPLIGLIGRVHPVKDHLTFLRAARQLCDGGSPAHFLLAGRDTTDPSFLLQMGTFGLRSRIHALGERADIAELTAALDVATCCSRSEAFPNTIGEAMACGVPCVTTDVGDCARLVEHRGRVVPSGDAAALCAGWCELLELPPGQRRCLGERARQCILREFSLDHVASQYAQLYAELVQSYTG